MTTATPGASAAAAGAASAALMSDEERVDDWMLELRRLVQNRPPATDLHASPKRESLSAPGQGLGRQAKDEGLGASGIAAAEEGQGLGVMWAVVRALLTCRVGSVLGALAAGAPLDPASPSPAVSTALALQSNSGGVAGQGQGLSQVQGGGTGTSTSRELVGGGIGTGVVQGSVKTMGGLSHIRCIVPPVVPATQTKALPSAAAGGGAGKGSVAGGASEDMGEFVVLRESGAGVGQGATALVCYAGNFKKVEGADVLKALQAVDR